MKYIFQRLLCIIGKHSSTWVRVYSQYPFPFDSLNLETCLSCGKTWLVNENNTRISEFNQNHKDIIAATKQITNNIAYRESKRQ